MEQIGKNLFGDKYIPNVSLLDCQSKINDYYNQQEIIRKYKGNKNHKKSPSPEKTLETTNETKEDKKEEIPLSERIITYLEKKVNSQQTKGENKVPIYGNNETVIEIFFEILDKTKTREDDNDDEFCDSFININCNK